MTATTFNPVDARLLNLLQSEFPLVHRPFATLGEKLDLAEAEVIARILDLKQGSSRVIRQISAIFDSHALGYRSTLVAAVVEPDRLDEAAGIINSHPGVSHNYKREHRFNLWYTLTVPPDSRLGLEKTVDLLHRRSGAQATRMLPALKVYKIGVKFDVGGESDLLAAAQGKRFGRADEAAAVTELDKSFIRALQRDLPMVARPFDELAREIGCCAEELIEAARRYLDLGWMRRFSAVLRHRAAGFGANAMAAWNLPEGGQDAFGELAAGFAGVSHCYRRPTFDDWPYSVFTMVHGQSKQQCEELLAEISSRSAVKDYAILYSTKEYKKVRVQYFTPELTEWEAANA